ncbi:hypothetical protein D3C85_1405310 [compost metagenome]
MLVALMAVFGHLHHPDEALAEMLAENGLGPGKITADVQDDEPLMGLHQWRNLGDHLCRIVAPVTVEGQYGVVLLGPGQGRPVHRLGFGQDGAHPSDPGQRLDKIGPVGEQMGDQQDTEALEARLLDKMAKKQMLRSLTAQLCASLVCRKYAGRQNPAWPGSVCVQIKN